MANQRKFFPRLAALIAMVVLTGLVAVGQSSAVRLVTQKVDESKLTTLAGHVHPAANALNDRGPVDDSAPVGHVALLLRRSAAQQLDLDALVDQLHNPKSENYHKWLTPESFGRRFGPADEDVAAVASWLQSKGFTIEDMPASKTHITFTGTVGQMRDAFHIDVHHLSVNGQAHQSTMNEPQIPSALAPVVSGFRQLNDFGPKPANHFAGVFKKDLATGKLTPAAEGSTAPHADFTNSYNSQTYYEVGPQDFYTIYNETPLLSAGTNGAGVTIAVIEQTQINGADPVSFRSQFGLPTYPATPTSAAGGINYIYGTASGVGGDAACTAPLSVAAGMASGDEGEADIDVEWAGTAAPNATIDLVACGTTAGAIGSFGTDLAAEHIANYLSNSVTAASLSYLVCEADTGNTSFYSGLWEQYAAQGQTAVVSSGDGGSMGCETLTNNPSVNVMSATAYNISAGGTDFGDAYISDNYATEPASTWWSATNGKGLSSAKSYIPETTWGGYCSNALFVSYLQKLGNTTFGTTYTPEAVCNSSYSTRNGYTAAVGGAGGPSAYTKLPSWQSVYGIGLYSSSTTYRNQPDISLFAANGFWGHALPFCESDEYPCTYSVASDGYNLESGGTSFPAPQIAGIIALINQATGQAQGQADYTLYALAAQEYGTTTTPNTSNLAACSGSAQGANVGSTCIFRDIAADTPSLQGGVIASQIIEPCTYASVTDCYHSVTGDTYGLSAITTASHSSTLAYSAGAGYDLATGLGSVNIDNLVTNWNSLTTGFASTTALAASATTIAYSTTPNLTLTATVTATGRGSAFAPGGAVQFFFGGSTSGTLLGTGSIAANCTGAGSARSCDGIATLSLPTSVLAPGANSLVAYFEGDAANDAPSTSTAKTVTVNSWPQTITITSPNTATYGTKPTVTAASSSGLTTFTFSVVSGPATITATGGVLTFTGVGPVVVQVSQAGTTTYAAASAQQTIAVSPATPTLTVASSLNPSTYGASVTFTATISSGPTGTVTFYDGGTAIGTGAISGGKATYATKTLTAGSHSITAGWAGNTDYNAVTSSAITQVVNQAAPAITWATPSAITYGTALSATQLNATANVPGTFAYTPASGTVLTAGSQTLSVLFTPTDATDYSTATKNVTLTVNQAAPAITWATPAAITYGTALSATQLNASITWTVGTNNINVGGTFTYNPVAGTVLTAGTHTLSVTFVPSDTTDYKTPTAKTVTLTVNQATPTISWPTPAPVPYNTALSATQLDATATWTVGGTNGPVAGTFTYTPAAGTLMTTIGANTLKVTFAPTDKTDYSTPAATTVILTVTQATPTVTWPTPAAINYGTALSGTQLDATSTVAGTFVYTPGSGTVLTAGTHSLSVTFTPTNSTDYSTVTTTVQLTVNQTTPTITWATPATITYGTALSANQLNATANVPGTFAYTPAAGTVLTAGSQTLSVLFTPTDTTDYGTATKNLTLTVNQAAPAISWATPAAITYGTALSATQLDAAATWTVGGTNGQVAGTFTYTPAAGTVLTAGSHTLSVTFAPTDTTDYKTPSAATVTLTVNQATPTITWPTPAAITYGTALSATQLAATSTVAGNFVYTPAAGTVLTAGSQTLSVTLTPTDSTDYTTATKTVTLTVNQATPTITWPTPAAITYGTALSATQLAATSTVPGNFVYTPASGTVLTAGSQTLSVTLTPTDSTDYTTATKTVTLNVNQATPTITWPTPAAITYGTALSAAQLDAASTVSGNFVYTPATGAVLGAGSQTLSVTLTPTDSTDYTTATKTVTLTVNQATPTITWPAPAAITYGTALSGAQLDATSTVLGTFAYTPAAGAVLTAGSQTLSVTLTPTDSTDYTTATKTVTLTVNQATPTITWPTPAAITYGTALSATQLAATSTVPGNFVYTPASGTVLTAGSQTLSVTLTPTDSTDYTTATRTVTLTVNQATPTITWPAPAPITYGTALSATPLAAASTVLGTFTYTPAAGAVLGAGSQILSVTLTPTDTTDYATATTTVQLQVTQATPVLAWTPPSSIVYGTPLGALQLDASANVSGNFTYTPAAGVVLPTGSQTLSALFTPTDTVDYATANISVGLLVTQATPVINWPTPAPITFGTPLSATQLDATSPVLGSFVYSPALGALLSIGTQTLSVVFTPTDTNDYTAAAGSVTLTVNPAPPVSSNFGPVNIGSSASATVGPFVFSSAVTLGSTTVVTQGATGLDFTDAGTGTCAVGTAYSAGQSCTIAVNFAPLVAGARNGAAELFDQSGNLIGAGYLQGVGVGPQVAFAAPVQPAAVTAAIPQPASAITDSTGNLFVASTADAGNDPNTGAVYEIPISSSGFGTPVVLASGLSSLQSLALDGAGNLFAASSQDSAGDANSGAILEIPRTQAGYGAPVSVLTGLSYPNGGWFDGFGNLFFTTNADSSLDPASGTVVELPNVGAGFGQPVTIATGINFPGSIQVDPLGNLFLTSCCQNGGVPSAGLLLEIPAANPGYGTPVTVSTGLVYPRGLALEASGNILFTSSSDAASDPSTGVLYEIPYTGSGYGLPVALFTGLNSAAVSQVDGAGNIYMAGPANVYEVARGTAPTLAFAATSVTSTSSDSPRTVTILNIGNAALTFTGLSYPTDFPEGAGDANACTSSTSLSPAGLCDLPIDFTPQSLGPLSENVTLTDNALNVTGTTQSITVSGTGNLLLPVLITPTPGSVLGTSNVTFSWTPGIGVSQYMLWLGTTGVDSRNIFESGALTANSVIVPSLPGSFPSGVTVYATLVSCINGQWLTADYVHYTFTETQGVLAVLNTPTPGSVLGTTGVTFSWSPGTAVTKYALYLGTTGIGSANRFESAALTGNSVIVPSLPAGYPSGGIVYARLLSFIGGSWYSADYTYTETQGVLAALTTPIPGPATVLGTTNVTFSWSPGIGVTQYALYLGTTGVGSANRFESAGMTATNVTVPSLPAGYPSGGIVYARLWSNIGGAWYSADYTYTETQGALAVLNTPTPGSVLGTTGVYFSWSPGTAVTQYALYLGTTGVGSADRFESAGMTATNVTVPSLPANGATVYARLWSNIGGSWYSADYTYTEQQ